MVGVTESIVEQFLLDELARLGYCVISGPGIAPDQLGAERADFAQVILPARLRSSLQRLNPHIPADALGETPPQSYSCSFSFPHPEQPLLSPPCW